LSLEHEFKLTPRHPSMIERFRGFANIKSCKKWPKSARINLHHLRMPDPLKNRVLLAKFRANLTNGFQDIAKNKSVPTYTCKVAGLYGEKKVARIARCLFRCQTGMA